MAMKMRLKRKNRSHRYDINRPRPRQGHRCTKYRMCIIILMVTCIKQLTSNILINSLVHTLQRKFIEGIPSTKILIAKAYFLY